MLGALIAMVVPSSSNEIENPKFIIENKVELDYEFYITNQIMKPVQQLFALIIEQIPDYKKKPLTCKKLKRIINIKRSNSDSLVVWNPGKEKANAMSDMGKKDEWRRMVCIETANTLENSVVIYPKLSHSISTEYSVQEY